MTESPLVSVLMPSYNTEKYIGFAIESILNSTYTNFELIIVDDRSADNTLSVARQYANKDNRVKVFLNETNLGDYPNRNKAASYAKGKYLKSIDHDDYIYPWALELLVQMMEQFPQAGWGLCSLVQNIDKPFPFLLTPAGTYAYHYAGPGGLLDRAPLSCIIKRDVFEKEGGFATQRWTGDFELWHRLALRYNVLLMPDGMVWYREHEAQETKNAKKSIADRYEAISLRYLNSSECPLQKREVTDILKRKKSAMLKQLVKGMVKMNRNQVESNWKCIRLLNRRNIEK